MACRNAPVPFFPRLIYNALRWVVRLGLQVIYRRRLVLGREHLRFDGPAIVVVNHPSTLMDVLNPAAEICQEMFFLANYGLFRHPISRWLLTRFFCIPVMRAEDLLPGEVRDNTDAFEACFRHLERGGVLFIAPEGVSWMNRFVRPFKTGTARIALGAEARNRWQLDVKIIPIGLSYSMPERFRGDVVICAGPAVRVADWRKAWEEAPAAAIEALTQHLEEQVRRLTIHAVDETGEQALGMWEEMSQNEHPLPQAAAFERSRQLARACLGDAELVHQTLRYRQLLQRAALSDRALRSRRHSEQLWRRTGLLLGGPLFALGCALWFLPCFIPYWLRRRLRLYVGYNTTVMLVAGFFVFPLYGWALFQLARWGGLPVGAALSLPALWVASGIFVERYSDLLQEEWGAERARRWRRRHADQWAHLVQLRAAILDRLSPLFAKSASAPRATKRVAPNAYGSGH